MFAYVVKVQWSKITHVSGHHKLYPAVISVYTDIDKSPHKPRVTSFKLLGVHLDSSLAWSTHINHIIKKATTRLYFLKQFKRAGLSSSHLLHFYITVIRPVFEYCAPLLHYALTKAQSESLEAVQKRAIRIVHIPTDGMPYSSMLFLCQLEFLGLS